MKENVLLFVGGIFPMNVSSVKGAIDIGTNYAKTETSYKISLSLAIILLTHKNAIIQRHGAYFPLYKLDKIANVFTLIIP